MTQVDPFVVKIPDKIANDPELCPFFDYFVRWAHDMWVRTGAGDDSVEEIEIGELYEPGISDGRLIELENQVNDLENLIEQYSSKIEALEEELKRRILLCS